MPTEEPPKAPTIVSELHNIARGQVVIVERLELIGDQLQRLLGIAHNIMGLLLVILILLLIASCAGITVTIQQ